MPFLAFLGPLASGSVSQSSSGLSAKQWAAGFQGLGAIGKGIGASMEYSAHEKVQGASAKSNELLAAEAKKKAAWDVTKTRLEKRKWIGNARAMFGWLGVDIEGSPMDAIAEAEREMTLDEMMTERSGLIDQQIYLEEAKWARAAAKAAKKAGTMSMISAGIGAAQGIASIAALSDERIKRNIQPVTDALAKVRQLAAYRYNFAGSDRECIGLLAQEVEKMMPQAVQETGGVKKVDLYGIQSLIVSAIRELEGKARSGFGAWAV